jgi:dTDP-4-dehydrorhamnose reductase
MVFGGGGQVGCHLLEAGSSRGRATIGLVHSEADICDTEAVAAAIAKHAPTSIVNAAAYTAVDKAESEAMRAFQVNRDGASVVAEAAAKANMPLIHLSTDYVFDGSSRVPYKEDDKVNPQGSYATSKEAGERAVRAHHEKHLILRTAWVYGPFGTNFLKTMLRLGAEREELRVVDDQTGRPTSTEDLAGAILTLVESIERPGFSGWGTYHYAGADTATWYGFATMIFAEAARFGRKSRKSARSRPPNFRRPLPGPLIRCSTRQSSNALSASSLGRSAPVSSRRSRGFSDRGKRHERHHLGRRLRLAALSHHHRHEQAADGRLQ